MGDKGQDNVVGGSGNDSITGFDANDTLSGGSGDDLLSGDLDADVLTGGDGNDRFIFRAGESAGAAADRITDFQRPGAAIGDRIDLSAIDANTTVAGDQAFLAGTGTGRGRAVEENGNTVIYGNTDNDADYELRIVIADGAVPASAYTAEHDFIL